MIEQRLPRVAENIVTSLEDRHLEGCLGELQDAARSLDHQGFVTHPSWAELRRGKRPPLADSSELVNGNTAGNSTRLPPLNTSSGRPWSLASRVVPTRLTFGRTVAQGQCGCPTGPEFQVEPEAFRILVFERLRLPLPITDATCGCGVCLDLLGRHRAACPRSGRLRTRAVPTERTLARVCREAGAFVRVNAKLRDMNVEVRADDERATQVLASGLPIHQGAQLAVDITVRSPLTSTGLARPGAATTDGAVLVGARADKKAKYTQLLQGNRCHLVVVGLETGGRWSTEATTFVDMLAASRAREVPSVWRRTEGARRDLADLFGEQ